MFTDKAVPLPPAKPSPAIEEDNWVAVIPASATFTPLAPTDKVDPSGLTVTVASAEPLKEKATIPFPSVNSLPSVSAVIPVNPDPSPENEPVKTTEESPDFKYPESFCNCDTADPDTTTFFHSAIFNLRFWG